MIVEFFGPPGAGKTTLAGSIAAQMRQSGLEPKLVLSYRPNEHPVHVGAEAAHRSPAAAIRRLARPAVEFLSVTGRRNRHRGGLAATLLNLLPPKSIMWSIRMHQYLVRLGHTWREAAEAAEHVTLIDQGYLQAVYSLALLSGNTDRSRLELALEIVPKPDLVVQLDVPKDVIARRLGERRRLQSRVERLLDLDIATNLGSLPIAALIADIMREKSFRVLQIPAADRADLVQVTKQIANEIAASCSFYKERAHV